MTALAPAADLTAGSASTDSATRLARIRGLPAAVRASEYMTVGRSRRFRAVQRRRTRTAARAGFLVVAASVALDATVLLGLGGESTRPAIALDAVVMLAALAGWWQLPRRLYRRDPPELFLAAERLRTAVLELGIEHPANPSLGVVSVSIGATLLGDDTLSLSDEQWFWVVDRAMYAAKAGGRNQVRLATGLAA